jgi:hypothetical protein
VDTDKAGRYTLRFVNTGTYEVDASKISEGYTPQNRSFYRHSPYSIQKVVLDDSNPAASVSITLGPKSGSISGKAVDGSTGRPIESLHLTMCHANKPSHCYSESAKNDKGVFKVYGSAVPFTLKIEADGYETWFGLSELDRPQKEIFLASATTMELNVSLKRRIETIDVAMSEGEKQVNVHLPAPKQLSPAVDAVFDHYPRDTTVSWSEVEGAAYYVLELDYCKGLDKAQKRECIDPQPFKPKLDILEGTSYQFLFVGTQPGRWRVWAIDREGRAGFKSPWRTFFYE